MYLKETEKINKMCQDREAECKYGHNFLIFNI